MVNSHNDELDVIDQYPKLTILFYYREIFK